MIMLYITHYHARDRYWRAIGDEGSRLGLIARGWNSKFELGRWSFSPSPYPSELWIINYLKVCTSSRTLSHTHYIRIMHLWQQLSKFHQLQCYSLVWVNAFVLVMTAWHYFNSENVLQELCPFSSLVLHKHTMLGFQTGNCHNFQGNLQCTRQ